MKSSANTPNALAKTLTVALALCLVGILMLASRLTSSSAALQERIFENRIPAHIPIKIKIKKEKEKSFKNLKNEKWLRDFELEVTNTGDRPIYYLEITMNTGVMFDGSGPAIVFPLRYGRAELGDIVTKATSDDVPIKPGETYILTAGDVTAWERGVREKRWPEATKFKAEIQVLSFGDGTGYFGTELYPPPGRRKAAANNNKLPQSPKARARPRERLNGKLGAQSRSSSMFKQPTFMSANFLSSESVITAAPSAAQPPVTCQFPECTPVVPWTGYVCYDNNQQNNACRIQNRPTPDQINGVCKELEFTTVLCTAGNVIYACQKINVHECGFGPAPTPTPSPTPSPEPCLYCGDPLPPNALHAADCSNPSQPKCDPLLFEYELNGCCYRETCDHAGVVPPPLQPCAPGYFRTSNELQPFPHCDYLPCIPVPPNVIFMASADHEYVPLNNGEVDLGDSGLAIASGVPGAHGRVYDNNNGLLRKYMPSLQTSLGARMRFMPRGPLEQANLIVYRDDSPYAQSRVRLNTDGSIQVFRGSGSAVIIPPTEPGLVSPDTWYWLETRTFINNSNGVFNVRLWTGDGSTMLADASYVGDTQDTATVGATNITFGYTQASGTYVDDISVDTTQSELGPSRVEVLYPDAMGDFSQFTRTGVDNLFNFLQVNETYKDLNAFVNATGPEQFDFYSIGPRTIPGTPRAVQLWVVMNRVAGGPSPVSFTLSNRINGATFDGTITHTSGGTNYYGKGQVWSVNPATGVAWTDGEINSLQIGVHSFTSHIRVHQMVAEILVSN